MPEERALSSSAPSVVVTVAPRTLASTSASMLLKASDRPIETARPLPPPASEAASAAAPAIASIDAWLSATTETEAASISAGVALGAAISDSMLEWMRFSA